MRVDYSLLKLKLETLSQSDYKLQLTGDQVDTYRIDLADNQLFRLIRVHYDEDVNSEELIKKIKEKKDIQLNIKETNYGNILIELKNDLEKKNNEIKELNFIKDIIFIEIPSSGDKKEINKNIEHIYRNGIIVNGLKYKRWGKSSSMTRHNIIAFMSENIYDDIYKRAMMDIELKEVIIAKWEAYFNLLLSSCEFISEVPYTVVVDDYCTILDKRKFQYVVERIAHDKDTGEVIMKDNNENEPITYKDIDIVEKDDIEMNWFDGEGIITKETSLKFKEDLGLTYKPCAYIIRMPFIKGLVIEMDFKLYCEENNVTEITDYWGVKHKASDVEMVITKSQFKAIKEFKNWNDYMQKFKKYDHKMGVTRYNKNPKSESPMSRYNFQYLQTLPNLKGDIIEVAKYSVDWAKNIIKGDKLHTLLFLGTIGKSMYEELSDDDELEQYNAETSDLFKDIFSDSDKYTKAILLNDVMLNDVHIQHEYLYKMLEKYIREMKFGKIWVEGKYEFLYSDTYALMQHICGHKVTGLLRENEHWSNKKQGKYLGTRSPLVDFSEMNKMNFINNKLTQKWFGHLYHGIMLNVYGIDVIKMSDCD